EQPVFDGEHRGRVDGFALENTLDQLAAFGQAEDFRQRAGRRLAFEPLDGARTKYDHSVGRFAAKGLLPAEGPDIDLWPVDVLCEGRRRRVADGEPGAVGGNPVSIWHSDAAGRAVPGEDDVVGPIDSAELGNLAIVCGADFGVEPQLPRDVAHPAR